jgi:hypothetical protein
LLWLFFGQGINWFFAIIFDHQIALVFRFFSKVVHRVLIREWVLKLVGESGSCGQLLSVVLVVGCRMGHWRPGWRGRRVRQCFVYCLGMLLCVGCRVAPAYPTRFLFTTRPCPSLGTGARYLWPSISYPRTSVGYGSASVSLFHPGLQGPFRLWGTFQGGRMESSMGNGVGAWRGVDSFMAGIYAG